MKSARLWTLGIAGFGGGMLLLGAWLTAVLIGDVDVGSALTMLVGLFLPVFCVAAIASRWGYEGLIEGLVVMLIVITLAFILYGDHIRRWCRHLMAAL